MPEEPWSTKITIYCGNEALRGLWQDIEATLIEIVYRCGWDTRLVTRKLIQVDNALGQVRDLTVDMNKAPSKRFKQTERETK